MKLSDLKQQLGNIGELSFVLPNGTNGPQHFHVTEVGQITKHFIDCGGTVRNEKVVNFQLWEAGDTDHRLEPQKLAKIIPKGFKFFFLFHKQSVTYLMRQMNCAETSSCLSQN